MFNQMQRRKNILEKAKHMKKMFGFVTFVLFYWFSALLRLCVYYLTYERTEPIG